MKIAVTGATGHLGSKVIEHLNKEKKDLDIVALVHNKNHAHSLIEKAMKLEKLIFKTKIV